MLIFSIVNQKGGVLKTTLTVNLGAGLALKGYNVLVIDLDSQCNLTQSLIGDIGDTKNISEIILSDGKENIFDVIQKTSVERLHIAPAGESLASAELQMSNIMTRQYLLEKTLQNTFLNKYDFILIDNSPSIGLLTLNSLVASHYALIPISCEFLPMVGLKYIINTIKKVQDDKRLNPDLEILGYILTLYDKREAITLQVENMLRERFGDKVFKNVIRINTKAKAAPAKQQSIFHYENLKGRGTQDFKNLTIELIEKLKHE